MAFYTRDLWFITPLQAIATLGVAANFGGSVLQSPLIMPMLQLEKVPVQYAGVQTAYLLHNSEFFFPPTNMLCTLSNLAVTITSYLYRDTNAEAAAKLPWALAGFVLNAATTAYALGIMVPMNKKMARNASVLETKNTDQKNASELRELQKRWQTLNYGRATLMASAAIAGVIGLLQDGALVKIPSI